MAVKLEPSVLFVSNNYSLEGTIVADGMFESLIKLSILSQLSFLEILIFFKLCYIESHFAYYKEKLQSLQSKSFYY